MEYYLCSTKEGGPREVGESLVEHVYKIIITVPTQDVGRLEEEDPSHVTYLHLHSTPLVMKYPGWDNKNYWTVILNPKTPQFLRETDDHVSYSNSSSRR